MKPSKSLVSKGKKKPAAATPSSPLLTPAVSSVSSLVSQPALPSVSDDQKIKEYVHSILSSFLSQTGSVGTNPSISASTVVPDSAPPLRGATRGVGAAILMRGQPTEPSGMVPPVQKEDVNPLPLCHCVMCIIVGLI